MVHPDNSKTIFLTIGDTTPDRIGTVMRSQDTGKTWKSLSLSEPPNSAMWVVSVPFFNSQLAFAGSRHYCFHPHLDVVPQLASKSGAERIPWPSHGRNSASPSQVNLRSG